MTLKDKLWYYGWVAAGIAWLAVHYAIERHAPDMHIAIGAGMMLAYGVWGARRSDFKAFAKDAGEAIHDLKDGDDGA